MCVRVKDVGCSSSGSIGTTDPLTPCGPFTVIIHGSSMSLSCLDSSLNRVKTRRVTICQDAVYRAFAIDKRDLPEGRLFLSSRMFENDGERTCTARIFSLMLPFSTWLLLLEFVMV